jgi:hypothetical protein
MVYGIGNNMTALWYVLILAGGAGLTLLIDRLARRPMGGTSLPALPEGYAWKVEAAGYRINEAQFTHYILRLLDGNGQILDSRAIVNIYDRVVEYPLLKKGDIINTARRLHYSWSRDTANKSRSDKLLGTYPPKTLNGGK